MREIVKWYHSCLL